MTVYTLYKKTHRKTGLNYLGYTKRKNPYKYKGSGIVWTRHIEKYGYDVDTEILLQTEDKHQIKPAGIYYGQLWNVVNSKEWANLKEEDGQGGSMPGAINGMFGKVFWHNGTEMVGATECPGDGWIEGRLPGTGTTGKITWNNGTEQLMSSTSPGTGWKRGRLSGAIWWTNGIEEKKLYQAPDANWYKGRAPGHSLAGYKVWNNGLKETRAKESPGPEWKTGALTGKTTGKQFWNNGIECKMFKEPPGTGWVLGMLKR